MHMALEQGHPGVCGCEANGGFLLMSAMQLEDRALASLPSRDAVQSMLAVRASARAEARTMSTLLDALPARFTCSDRIQNFLTALSQARLASLQYGSLPEQGQAFEGMFEAVLGSVRDLNAADALRAAFANEEVIHLRPSENAPELRYYTKAMSAQRTAQINTSALGILSDRRQE